MIIFIINEILKECFVRKECMFDVNIHSVSIFLISVGFLEKWNLLFSILISPRFKVSLCDVFVLKQKILLIVSFLTSGRFLEQFLPYCFILSFHLQEYSYLIFVHTLATFLFSYFYGMVTISCPLVIFSEYSSLVHYVVVILLILIFNKH